MGIYVFYVLYICIKIVVYIDLFFVDVFCWIDICVNFGVIGCVVIVVIGWIIICVKGFFVIWLGINFILGRKKWYNDV